MQSRIKCSLEIQDCCKCLDCNMEKQPSIVIFFYRFLVGARLNNWITGNKQHNGMTNSEMDVHMEECCFVKTTWKMVSLKMK